MGCVCVCVCVCVRACVRACVRVCSYWHQLQLQQCKANAVLRWAVNALVDMTLAPSVHIACII